MDIKVTIRNIAMIVGIAAVSVSGLVFILFADLYLKADSVQLFLGIFFPLASVVFFILGESFKHKAFVFYLFKAFAFVFALGFTIYTFWFSHNALFMNNAGVKNVTFESAKTYLKLTRTLPDTGKTVWFLNPSEFNDGIAIPFDKGPIYLINQIISILGIAGVGVNTVFHSLIGLD